MNRLHAALPTSIKKYAWDLKYGLLGYPQFVAPKDVLQYLPSRLSENSSILDLGCGRGSLLRALRAKGWTGYYCGVDISKVAIHNAGKLADQRSSWSVSDFELFRSPFKWDVVTMIESLCYVKLEEIPAFLPAVIGLLTEHGALLFRLHDLEKHREYVDSVYRLYPQTQKVDKNLFCVSARAADRHYPCEAPE
jgi:predicted TPR repeat methyltransferase